MDTQGAAGRTAALPGGRLGPDQVAAAGIMEKVRVEINDLRNTLAAGHPTSQPGTAQPDPTVSGGRGMPLGDLIRGRQKTLDALFAEVSAREKNDPHVLAELGPAFTKMSNSWGRVLAATGHGATVPASSLGPIDDELAEMQFVLGVALVRRWLPDHLRLVNMGDALDFSAAFQDEMPDDVRRRVLAYIAAHPDSLGCLTDERRELIYPVRKGVKALTPVLVVGLLILVGAFISYYAATGLNFTGGGRVLRTYAAVLTGAILDVTVWVIMAKAPEPRPTIALSDNALLWLKVRLPGFVVTVMMCWVVTLVLALYPRGWSVYLFALVAGFALDALIAIGLGRFSARPEARAAARAKRFQP